MTNKYTKYKKTLHLPNKICNHALRHALHTCLRIWHAHDARHFAYACLMLYMSVFADHTRHRCSLRLTTCTCRICRQPAMPIKFRLLTPVCINKTCVVYYTFQSVCMQYTPVHSFTWYSMVLRRKTLRSEVFRRQFIKQKAQFLFLWIFRLV